MSQITIDEVMKLARLAKIELTEEEAKKYQKELGSILGYVKELDEVDTEGVEPTAQVTGLVNSTRKDEVVDYGTTPEELIKNAPDSQDGYVKVRKVL